MATYLGTTSSDSLTGSSSDDTFIGYLGNDTIIGGSGTDTVIFQGNREDYIITRVGNTFVINDSVSGRDQTDTVSGVEKFQFADFTIASKNHLTKTWLSDLNGDGRSDFYWRSASSDNPNDQVWTIPENSVTATTISTPTSLTAGSDGFIDASIIDFTYTSGSGGESDGVMDYVVLSSDRKTTNYRTYDSINGDFTYDEGSIAWYWQYIEYAGHGDINGDGSVDVLFKWDVGDTVEALLGGENGSLSANYYVYTNYSKWDFDSYFGDMNEDGIDDLMIRLDSYYDGSSSISILHMSSSGSGDSEDNFSDPGQNWIIKGIHDFDGNGTDDILFRNSATGDVVQWATFADGVSGSLFGNVDATWELQGAGDFNGDGTEDLLWKNSETGMVVDWLMEGSTSSGHLLAESLDSTKTFQGIGDYDGNGKADIVWRDSATDEVTVWFMDGGSFSQYTVGSIASTYQLVSG